MPEKISIEEWEEIKKSLLALPASTRIKSLNLLLDIFPEELVEQLKLMIQEAEEELKEAPTTADLSLIRIVNSEEKISNLDELSVQEESKPPEEPEKIYSDSRFSNEYFRGGMKESEVHTIENGKKRNVNK